MLAIVAPGQGAQKPGFLTPWLASPTAQDRLRWLAAVADLDLIGLGTEGDEDQIRDTAVAQPLLVAAAILASSELSDPTTASALPAPDVVAGHSVGEVAAAAIAGVFSPESAMVFVRERGSAMAAAAALQPTSMTAVLRGETDEVLASIEAAGLTAANHNGPGQIVAAGTTEQLAAFADNPPPGARLVPLSVAGAFHTVHMEPAVDHLTALALGIPTHNPEVAVLSNADGAVVDSGRGYLDRLVGQVAHPVRWDLCLQTMSDMGVTGLLELPPAGTLTGIAKRHLPGAEVFNLNTPDDLDEARAFVSRHAGKSTAT